MTGYLGSLGRMVPIVCPADLSVEPVRAGEVQTTLGGRRFYRSAPRGHRSWSLRSSELDGPGDLAPVALFANGAWGDGPFWWLSPWAARVNVLTPGGSVLRYADRAGGTVSGPVQANDGTWFPSSAVSPAGGVTGVARGYARTYVAVPKGLAYTASLYVSAGQSVRVSEFDSSLGAVLASRTSSAGAGSGLRRVSVTATAAASTDALRLDVLGAGTCAGAAISLTPSLAPWGVGDGCAEAIVQGGGIGVTSLAYGPYASQSYEILEVGG